MVKTRSMKRPLQEMDPNVQLSAPPAKAPFMVWRAEDAMAAAHSGFIFAPVPLKGYRIPSGPYNKPFLPAILPKESLKIADEKILPLGWTTFDGSPGRTMTLADEAWWEVNLEWLEKNRRKLGLTADQWGMRVMAKKQAGSPNAIDGKKDDDWVCICLPFPEPGTEKEAKTDRSAGSSGSDESDDELEDHPCGAQCLSGKPADLHPDHTWIMTVLGRERRQWWQQELAKRDPDCFDMYMYNDFPAYGSMEVATNAIIAFRRAFSQKDKSPLSVWSEIEGLAFSLAFDGLDIFRMGDDGERSSRMVELVGHCVLATVDYLVKQGQFKQGSDIRNLGVIITVLLWWGQDQEDFAFDHGEADWRFVLAKQAKLNGVKLVEAGEMQEAVKKINADTNGPQASQFNRIRWRKEVESYIRDYGSGGQYYDITKFPKYLKLEHSYSLGKEC